jgi:hypothetical protein
MICLKTLLIDKLWIYWAYKLYLFCETKLTKKYFKIDKFKNQLKQCRHYLFKISVCLGQLSWTWKFGRLAFPALYKDAISLQTIAKVAKRSWEILAHICWFFLLNITKSIHTLHCDVMLVSWWFIIKWWIYNQSYYISIVCREYVCA